MQLRKDEEPIISTPSGIVIVCRTMHPLNASFSIFNTPCLLYTSQQNANDDGDREGVALVALVAAVQADNLADIDGKVTE